MFCPACGTQVREGVNFCPNCGTVVNQHGRHVPITPTSVAPEMPMGWYNFLIYFALFASAVLNFINAVGMFTGAQYGGGAQYFYAFFEGLKILDIIVGFIMLAIAALAVYVRFRLLDIMKTVRNC